MKKLIDIVLGCSVVCGMVLGASFTLFLMALGIKIITM